MLRVVPELGPRVHWSRDEPRASALMSHGGPVVAMIKITHNEKASITRVQIGSRSKNQPIITQELSQKTQILKLLMIHLMVYPNVLVLMVFK